MKVVWYSPLLNQAAGLRVSSMPPNPVNSNNTHRKYFFVLNYDTKVIPIVLSSSLAAYFDLFHLILIHQDLYDYKEI